MPVPRITKEELKQRLDAGDPAGVPVLLDVRLKYPYEHSGLRLPGALRMPAEALDVSRLPRDRAVVVYDSDPDEIVSVGVAADLIRRGYQASALKGGINEWVGANYPVEPKEATDAGAAPAGGASER
jgi:rhodanese-related sulfurtransferase